MKKLLILTEANIVNDEVLLSADFYRFIDMEKMKKEMVKTKIKGGQDDSLTELASIIQFANLRRRFGKNMKLHLINLEEDYDEKLFREMIEENNQEFIKLIRSKSEFVL